MRALPFALACVYALLACSDGVGTPVRVRAEESRDTDGGEGDGEGDGERRSDEYDAEHCRDTEAWPAELATSETTLLDAIQALRADGFECEGNDRRDLEPLVHSRALQCSARLHSRDMVLRNFTGRTNPDEDGPGDRIRAAGFGADDWDESIAIGERTVDDALLDLLGDEDDCINVGTRRLTHIGIGRYEDRWTLDFARD